MATKRPRPRPRARVAVKVDALVSSSQETTVDVAKTVVSIDDAFMVRRSRNWEEIDKKRAREMEKLKTACDSDEALDDDDGDGDDHAVRKTKGRPPKGGFMASKPLPSWTRQTGVITSPLAEVPDPVLKATSSRSPSVEVLEFAPQESTPRTSRLRKRRSKSRSLTPPPALTQAERMLAIQQGKTKPTYRVPSPDRTLEIVAPDLDSLHPELRKILEDAGQEQAILGSQGEAEDEPQVILNISWKCNPEDPEDPIIPDGSLVYPYGRRTALRELFQNLSEIGGCEPGSLVILHDGNRVFSGATPESLRIWGEGELDAMRAETYDYRHLCPDESAPAARSRSPSLALSEVEQIESKLRLVFRASSGVEVTMKVKPSVTCNQVLDLFAKKAKITIPASNGRVVLDGEKQNGETTLGELGLEDEDLVEIVGL